MDHSTIITEFATGVIGLIVVWAIVGNLVFKPILKLLEKREEATSGAEHSSESLKIEAAELRAQVEEELRSARQAASKERDQLVGAARKSASEKLGVAQQENQKVLAGKLQEIEAAKKAAESSLAVEAEHLANLMTSRVLNEKSSSYIQ